MGDRFANHVVWITGASSGLGWEMACQLAQEGATVVASARREDRLNALIDKLGSPAIALPCDVTDETQVASTVDAIIEKLGRLDVAIVNAGFSVSGTVAALSDHEWRRQFDVNIFGALNTIRHAMPHLQNSKGRIALIASVAGFVGAPKSGAYCASKAALRTIGAALSAELTGSGVSCTTINPGYVVSEISQVDNQGQFQEQRSDRRPAQLMWPTDRAVRVMLSAIHRRKREFVFTGHGKIIVFLARHFPWLVAWALGRGAAPSR